MLANRIDLVQQLQAHLESLRTAGVRFVPRGAAVPFGVTSPALALEPVHVPGSSDQLEARRIGLSRVAAEVARCTRCSELYSTRLQPVFGTGPLDPEVAFVADAPAAEEDAQGEPFASTGGQLLNRMLSACGFTREQVYLFYLVKCRGPKNRKPTWEECANCRGYFDQQFDLVRPKHLVALGLFAARILTNESGPVNQLRGTVHTFRGVPLICTHHPNEIVADATGQRKRDAWDDIKLLLKTMGRILPK